MHYLSGNDPTLFFSRLPIDLKVLTAQYFHHSSLPTSSKIDLFGPNTILQTYSDWESHRLYEHYKQYNEWTNCTGTVTSIGLSYMQVLLDKICFLHATLKYTDYNREMIKLLRDPENLKKYAEAKKTITKK